MRLLELFSGSGHVSAHWRSQGYETVTVDIDPECKPDICVDITKWNFCDYPPDHFDFIWASPDCTTWSNATHLHRCVKDGLVPMTDKACNGAKMIHTLNRLLKYFDTATYVIENPRGKLRHFEPMKHHPFRTTVYYNNYGFPYQKPTDLWSNVELWKEKPNKGTYKFNGRNVPFAQRALIPKPLIERVFNVLNKNLKQQSHDVQHTKCQPTTEPEKC